jgi:hypothetical protein
VWHHAFRNDRSSLQSVLAIFTLLFATFSEVHRRQQQFLQQVHDWSAFPTKYCGNYVSFGCSLSAFALLPGTYKNQWSATSNSTYDSARYFFHWDKQQGKDSFFKKFAIGVGTKVAAPDVSDVVLEDANTYAFQRSFGVHVCVYVCVCVFVYRLRDPQKKIIDFNRGQNCA